MTKGRTDEDDDGAMRDGHYDEQAGPRFNGRSRGLGVCVSERKQSKANDNSSSPSLPPPLPSESTSLPDFLPSFRTRVGEVVVGKTATRLPRLSI